MFIHFFGRIIIPSNSSYFILRNSSLIKTIASCNKHLLWQVILPLADICLPNQFEAELLTDRKIRTEEDARQVMDLLHSRGPSTVILSSTELGSDKFLLGLASRVTDGVKTVVRLEIPKFPAAFVGETTDV